MRKDKIILICFIIELLSSFRSNNITRSDYYIKWQFFSMRKGKNAIKKKNPIRQSDNLVCVLHLNFFLFITYKVAGVIQNGRCRILKMIAIR